MLVHHPLLDSTVNFVITFTGLFPNQTCPNPLLLPSNYIYLALGVLLSRWWLLGASDNALAALTVSPSHPEDSANVTRDLVVASKMAS